MACCSNLDPKRLKSSLLNPGGGLTLISCGPSKLLKSSWSLNSSSPGSNCSLFSDPASSRTLSKLVKALVGMNSKGGKVLTASINLVTLKDWVKVCNLVLPLTTMGKMEVFNTNSVEVKVSVTVFKAGVGPLEEAMTTACKVSMLEDKSTSLYSGPDEVKMFSGAGMVSVWKIGFEDVGAIVGLKVSVNVLESKVA